MSTLSKAALFAFSALTAAAQLPPPAPAAKSFEPGSLRIGDVTFTGSLRSRVEGFDWFEPTSGNNSYAYSGNFLRFSFSQKHESFDWNAEFAVPFLLGLPSNPVGPGVQGALGLGANYYLGNKSQNNAAMIFPKQLFLRFTPSKSNSLLLGRYEFQDGGETTPKNPTLANLKANRVNQRLIGPFVFTDIQRSFDGLLYSYAKPAGTFTFMAGLPTRGVFQVDGWGWNKTAISYTSFAKSWGAGPHSAETRVFAIYYDDWRRGVVKVDNRPASVRNFDFSNVRIWTAGGNSLHLRETKKATFDFLIWGLGQWGSWGPQDHSAYAFDFEAGFQPKLPPSWKLLTKLRPWLRGGISITSGDDNPADNTHATFFQLVPTPRPYARFPFFNMMNSVDRFGSLILRPHTKVSMSSEFHSLALKSAADLWYIGGGVFQPWTFGFTGRNTSGTKSLANLYDTSLEYRRNQRITMTAYVGYAQGLAVMKQIYPAGKNGFFGYGEVLFRF